MPDCNYFEELCSASLDGELGREQKRELEAHLETCPACAGYLEDLRLLRGAWGDLKEPLPDALHEQVMRGIVEEAESKVGSDKKVRRMMPVFTMLAAAAACVMLVMSGAIGDLLGGLSIAVPGGGSGMAGSEASTFGAQSSGGADAQDGEARKESRLLEDEAAAENGQSEAVIPFSAAPAGGMETQAANAAEAFSVKLPETLQAYDFGFCYVAVGSGEPPVLEQASLIEKDGSTYYFRIDNNMNSLEKLRAELQRAGYETAMRSDIGIAAGEDAADSLLILSQSE